MNNIVVARLLLYYTAIQNVSIASSIDILYSIIQHNTANTVYSYTAYTLYSAIHSPSD